MDGRRVVVVGATGALGTELVEVLAAGDLRVDELVPVATDHSLGEGVMFRDEDLAVHTEAVELRGAGVVFLCAPSEASTEWIQRALRAEVPCIDLSAALPEHDAIPLLAAPLAPAREQLASPVVATPTGPALAWSIVLAPLVEAFGLERVVGTHLESASGAGRGGVRSLEREVIALFNQAEPPETTVFPGPVAFDCIPEAGAREGALAPGLEQRMKRDLTRLLGTEFGLAVTPVRVPTFTGIGASLAVETSEAASPEAVSELFVKAPAVTLWDPEVHGPTTREATGRPEVLVGRVREDPSHENGILLWLAADPIHLAAWNAMRLAAARFEAH